MGIGITNPLTGVRDRKSRTAKVNANQRFAYIVAESGDYAKQGKGVGIELLWIKTMMEMGIGITDPLIGVRDRKSRTEKCY